MDYDCGYSANEASLRRLHQQAGESVQARSLTYEQLLPNWQNQWNRLSVPCNDCLESHWSMTVSAAKRKHHNNN